MCIANVCLVSFKRKQRGDPVISHPLYPENRQTLALNASSTLLYPRPITSHPAISPLLTLSRPVRFWYGGRCNIEGRSVCTLNLISQHSALPLPEEPFDWCPFEKLALGLTGGYGGKGGDQSSLRRKKKLFGARLLTAVTYNGFQLAKGKDRELIWASTGEPVMQYSCTQTNESPD